MDQCTETVIIVDDDEQIREVLVYFLESEGYRAVSAANGEEALGRLRRMERPAAIVLDLDMPIMNGRQFREHQLRDPALRSIPVVVLSGRPDVRHVAAEMEADSWLWKPIDMDALRKVLEVYRPMPGPASALPQGEAGRAGP